MVFEIIMFEAWADILGPRSAPLCVYGIDIVMSMSVQ